MDREKELRWWQFIRNAELREAMRYFPSDKQIKILEVGGRFGYQAKIISDMGYDIVSIDIYPQDPQHHPVQKGSINQLNFDSNTFDLIFSSNMLQEIDDIGKAFNEIKRVLKKNGLIIHIVPSSWWSLITNFWHYLLIPKYLANSSTAKQIFNLDDNRKSEEGRVKDKNVHSAQKNLKRLFLHPLGISPSFVHEIYYFSSFFWKKLFENYEFKIIYIKNCPYFYSAYGIFKMRFLKIRKLLAKCCFPSCYCFVLKKTS